MVRLNRRLYVGSLSKPFGHKHLGAGTCRPAPALKFVALLKGISFHGFLADSAFHSSDGHESPGSTNQAQTTDQSYT